MVGYAPLAENAAELCQRQGRYGPYNLHMNIPPPTSRTLKNTMVVSYFGGGIRIFRLVDVPGVGNVPPQIVEIGHLIPEAPPRNPTHTSEMGAVLVADDGLIYSNDRRTGGLYILGTRGRSRWIRGRAAARRASIWTVYRCRTRRGRRPRRSRAA